MKDKQLRKHLPSGANLQIMVEERLRELERVLENVQLVIEEIPGGSENLQL